ncbi:MAG: ABC transporter substrate-binding protein [Chloroflexota bacterium]
MSVSEDSRQLTRRVFLKVGTAAAGVGLLQACASPAAPATPAAQPTPVKPAAQVPQVPQAQATAAATKAATQAPAATKAAGPKKGGTFTMARTSSIEEFNPLNMINGHYGYHRAVYNSLAHYDANLKPQPELAEKWDFSADGKAVTLKLREGVKFHSGRDFTAEDVKASLEFGQTDDRAQMRSLFKTITAVEITGKHTIVFKSKDVNPGIYDLLDALCVIDKETLADRAKTAVGTGPFKLDKYTPKDRAEFVAFKDYWDKGKPYFDKYVLRDIPDLSTLAINLESGAVDCVWWPNFLDVVRLKNSGGKYVVDMGAPGASKFNVAMNVKVAPYTNKKVRQAIAWSIDRARFCKTSLQGLVEPSCLIWPPHSWGYFKDLEGKVGFDLEKAKALLKEAGMEKGFTTEIMCSSKLTPGQYDLAMIMQADLKKIGVEAKVVDLDSAQYNARTNAQDIIMMVHTYGRAGRDPGTTMTGAKAWYTDKEGAWTRFESAEYEKARADMAGTLDAEKRKAAARKIQEIALDECMVTPVAESPRPWVYRSALKGFSYNMDNAPFVGEFWFDE